MALKIRLRQQGRKNHVAYRLVLTDSRAPRDGKYIEMLGWYNPYGAELDKKMAINAERVLHWLGLGAILTEKAGYLIKQGAPQVMESYRRKQLEMRAKACKKRKAARKR